MMCAVLLILAALAVPAAGAVIPVSSLGDLVKIGTGGDWPLNGDYELTNDIDASGSRSMNRGEGFLPIGDDRKPFAGTFYGNGYKVSGLYINRPDANHVGLFGALGAGATVKNLSVIADTVIGRYAVGALAGGNDGVIRGCYSSGFVQAAVKDREGNAGGLVGVNGGRIAASFSGAVVNGRAHVGGLVGFLTAEISESYATGAVSGDNYVGGLVGYAFGGTISMSFSTGMVIGTGKQSVVGGLVGYDFGGSNAAWNSAGRVTVGSNAGKMVKEAKITECYWNINTSGISASAGGKGVTTADMEGGGLFGGWDYDSTWFASDSSFYPLLKDIRVFTVAYRAEYNGRLRVKGVRGEVDQYTMALGEGSAGLEVTAVPNAGCRFLRWSDGLADSARVDMAAADTAFWAVFEILPGVSARTLAYAAGENGRIRISGPNSAIDSREYSLTVLTGRYGAEVTAVPDSGYRFFGWGDGLGSPSRRDIAEGDMEYKAFFEPDNGGNETIYGYTTPRAGGLLRVNGNSQHAYSEMVASGSRGSDVVAVPSAGYRFSGWNDGVANIIRSDASMRPLQVTAEFEIIKAGGIIVISTVESLGKIGKVAGFPLNGDYELAANISAGDFEPIGTESAPFTGTFSGNGRTISNLRINRPGEPYNGLFGYAKNAVIRNVLIASASVAGGDNSGALIGYCENSFIDRCGATGLVSGAAHAGGLIGQVNGSAVNYCYSGAAVTASAADGPAGGLIGAVSRGSVFQCYSYGKVTGGTAGGFAGACANCAENREIFGCYWDTENSGASASAGGATGKSFEYMTLLSTYHGWSIGAPGNSVVWSIRNGYEYPKLTFAGTAYAPMPKRQSAAAAPAKPLVKLTGRKLSVNAPPNSAVQVRLIDIRGRTAARHSAKGAAVFSLADLPAGRYIAETRVDGKRKDVRRIHCLN
jgi:hypothetical protein